MPTSIALRDAVSRSNLPASEKTHIRRYWESIAPRASALAARVQRGLGISGHVARTGTQALRAGGEAVLLGGALGVVDAKLAGGLDYTATLGSNSVTVPIDLVAGIAGFGASMVPSLAVVSEDLNRLGVVGTASYAQRQAKAWAQGAPGSGSGGAAPASTAHGEDAVLAWAAEQG